MPDVQMPRVARHERATAETRVLVELGIDGRGTGRIKTGIGFFDHMLAAWAAHGLFDLTVEAVGDLHVDPHHTVEDCGIATGQALDRALGDREGIRRFGDATVPMDECLVLAAVDVSGRPLVVWDVPGLDAARGARLGDFDVELAREFFAGVAGTARLTLHVRQLSAGGNLHHLVEAVFKAAGMALSEAVRRDERRAGRIPSTKDVI